MNVESLALIVSVLKGTLIDELIQPLLSRITVMQQQIADLKAALDANLAVTSAAVANEHALKTALSAANDQIVQLQSQLTSAQAAALAPTDLTALTDMTAAVVASTQLVNDTNTVTAPSA